MTRFAVDEVRGQGRPRVGRGGRVYKPEADRRYEAMLARAYAEAGGGLVDGPVQVHVDVWRALPKSRPKGTRSEPDTFRPDLDNVAKSVLDALTGVAWADDRQVVELWVVKHERKAREGDLMVVDVRPA